MTIQSSNFHKLLRRRATRLSRQLMICALLSGVGPLSVLVLAQTTAPPPPATSTEITPPQTGQRPDSAIAEDINKKLMASNSLRPLDLGIWVHDGTATLTGTVPTQELKTQAEDMVKAVAGVKTVDDKITIGSLPATAPGFSGQNGGGQNGGQPGNQQSPPPPPPGYGQNQNAPSPQYPASPQSPGSPQSPPPVYDSHPRSVMVTVASGTPLYVTMMQTIDSHHTELGAAFSGILVKDIILQNGAIAIPRGAQVMGTVIDARGPGHLKGRPQLALQLNGLNVANTHYQMSSYVWARGGPGKGGQSAANIGGGAVMGSIVGGAFGGGPAALLGGLLGGLGGAGISSLSSGPRIIIPAESVLTFYLNAPLTVREPTMGEIRMLGSQVPPSAYGPRPRGYYAPGYPPPPGPIAPPPYGPPGGYPY
ncbi:MAG TPA: BON domain-containing protein [Acidobacteriaceae bacterium]|nr:BON domain-containing protein [Terriglobia bacterium]HVC91616.1 BON domain-containing protein [Acidobacteriaceae bacterium]